MPIDEKIFKNLEKGLKERIENARESLFEMQKEIRKAKSSIVVTEGNSAPKLAIEKCIEMCNYLLGAVQEFEIPFENIEEKHTSDSEENISEDINEGFEEDDV